MNRGLTRENRDKAKKITEKVIRKMYQKSKHNKNREKNREKKGGSCNFSSSGSFRNMADQLGCMVVSGVDSIVKGVESAYSVITLPYDLAWDFERPNQPMPQNTPI
jgi:hypothetical protein